MFILYHSNCLDTLCDLLVHFLRQDPPTDPFAQEDILVQSPGMAQWLKLEIAKRQGIAMGLRFPLPASFIWQMFETVLDDVPKENPYQKSILTWTLMDLLPKVIDAPQMKPLRVYLQRHTKALSWWLMCQNIADLFDQYQVYRPDWLVQWEAGKDDVAKKMPWQPFLWRTLVAHYQGSLHRAKRFQYFYQALKQNHVQGLPQRLFVFGVPAMAPQYVQALEALSQHCHVHYFLHNPCREYWGDLCDPSVSSSVFGNPLLSAWGKQGRDHLYLLSEIAPQEIEAFVEPDQNCLLAKLQHHILDLFNPTPYQHQSRLPADLILAPEDDSVRIHLCYSRVRELEVLYDQLLAWFDADQSLKPRDILVMAPDIDNYSAEIRAVFGSMSECDPRFIPFAISDQRLPSAYPLVKVFLQLLNLPSQRCQVTQILDILQLDAVQRQFGLNETDVVKLSKWIRDSGIRWGLTQQDGAQWQLPNLAQNTWLWGIERLFAGFACLDTQLVAGIRPFDIGTGLDNVILGGLSDFVHALIEIRQQLQEAKTGEQWCAFLYQLLHRFFQPEAAQENQMKAIYDAIDKMQQTITLSCYTHEICYEIVLNGLTQILEATQTSARFLAGAVNFCTLMPMRGIPFKRICLLGMNDGDYPRQTMDVSYDLIGLLPRRGDRSRREDDRYLFLEALQSAREKLYLSYISRSVQDNQVMEPSVLLATLRDYITGYFACLPYQHLSPEVRVGKMRAWIECEHPLVPYHTDYFDINQPRSFMYEWIAGLPKIDEKQLQSDTSGRHLLQHVVELEQLQDCVALPCQHYLQQQLAIFFPSFWQSDEDHEPFILDGLTRHQLKKELIKSYIHQQGQCQHLDYLQESGQFAHGKIGLADARMLRDEAADFYHLLKPWLQDPVAPLAIDFQLDAYQLQGYVSGEYAQAFVRYSVSSKVNASVFIRFWITYLCYCQYVPSPKPMMVASWDKAPYFLEPLLPKQAEDYLKPWLVLWDHACQGPVAFFPKTAWYWQQLQTKIKAPEELMRETCAFFSEPESVRGWVRGEGDNPYVRRCYPQWSHALYDSLTTWSQKLLQQSPLKKMLEAFSQ